MTNARQTKFSPIDGQERKIEMSRITALKNAKQRHVTVEPRLLYITPEIAKAILDYNTCNRALRAAAYQKYADDMSNGRWVAGNPDMVCIDSNANLSNGQHRLEAIVESGQGQWLWVWEEVAPELYTSMDSGLVRRDIDFIEDMPYKRTVDTIAPILNAINHGASITQIMRGAIKRNVQTSRQAKLACIRENQEKLIEYATMGQKGCLTTERKYAPHYAIAFMLIDTVGDGKCFRQFLCDVENPLPANMVIASMRARMLNNKNLSGQMSQRQWNVMQVLTAYEMYLREKQYAQPAAITTFFNKNGTDIMQTYAERVHARA